MGEVTVSVAGRSYQLVCEDGEEERLRAVAARVDDETRAFTEAAGQVPEGRLLLMASLMLADKLEETETELNAANAAQAAAPPAEAAQEDQLGMFAENALDEAAAAFDAIAVRLESLAPGKPAAAPATPRQQKSSAAAAAERDLLGWMERPAPASGENHPPGATEHEEALADDAGVETEAAPESSAQPDGPEIAAADLPPSPPELTEATAQEQTGPVAPEPAPDVSETGLTEAQAGLNDDGDDDLDEPETAGSEALSRRERRARRHARMAALAKKKAEGEA